jgi:hypothetical protein
MVRCVEAIKRLTLMKHEYTVHLKTSSRSTPITERWSSSATEEIGIICRFFVSLNELWTIADQFESVFVIEIRLTELQERPVKAGPLPENKEETF